nr:hypothetical protein [uncultured Lichenicoccus sp.]
MAYLPKDEVQAHLAAGQLARVLEALRPPYPGYRLYYPSRRQQNTAFGPLVEASRYRSWLTSNEQSPDAHYG